MSQFSNSSTSSPSPQGSAPSRRANVPLILVALGLGLVAVIANSVYINHIRSVQEGNKFTIYTLVRPVEPGDELRREDIKSVEMYERDREHYERGIGAITKEALSTKLGQAFTKYAESGQYLTYNLLTSESRTGSYELRKGMRAHVLPIDRDTTPPILMPNDTVDIMAYLEPPSGRSQTYLIQERVRVLAVGERTAKSQGRSGSFSTVTIEVTPEQAQQLSTILRYAPDDAFQLNPRNPGDLQETLNGEINPQVLNLLGLES